MLKKVAAAVLFTVVTITTYLMATGILQLELVRKH